VEWTPLLGQPVTPRKSSKGETATWNLAEKFTKEFKQVSVTIPICRCQFRSLDGALQNAELMTEREDLQLERCTAPEGSEKRRQERAQ